MAKKETRRPTPKKSSSKTLAAGSSMTGRAMARLSRPAKTSACIFAFAFIIRLLFLWTIRDSPTFNDPIIDAATYHRVAWQLAQRGSFDSVFFFQPVLYPLWLAFEYLLLGPSMLTAKIIQLACGALSCSLLYQLARPLSGHRIALAAALTFALYLPAIVLESELLATAYEVVIMLACLRAFAWLSAQPKTPWPTACFAGFLAALAILWRTTYLPLVAVWSLVFVWEHWRKRATQKWSPPLGGYSLGLGLPLLLISLLYYAGDGRFTFVPFSGGINFYLGNSEDYCSTVNIRPGLQWEKIQREPLAHGAVASSAQMDYFTHKTIGIMLSNPEIFIRNTWGKLLRLLSSRELPRISDPYGYGEYSFLARIGLWRFGPFGFPSGFILAFAFVGLVVLCRRLSVYVRAAVIIYPLSVMVVMVSSRYRMPVMPLLIWFAWHGVAYIYSACRQRSWRRIIGAAVNPILLGLVTVFSPKFCEEALHYKSEMYYILGTNSEQRGAPDEAISRYRQALGLDPSSLNARNNLALALNRRGHREEAIHQLEAGLALQREPKLLHSYAQLLAIEEGNAEMVGQLLREAVALSPWYDDAWISLGRFQHQHQQLAEAIASYQRAIAANPLSAIALNNLAVSQVALGQRQEAIANFTRATELDPNYGEAYFNWALALEMDGQIAAASRLYKSLTHTTSPLQLRAQERLKLLENHPQP